jgi:hypothetical protein
MMLLNFIPIIGWALAAVFCFIAAIPMYLLWNWLAPIYAPFLPHVYLEIPFWHMFGLLWLLMSIRQIVFGSNHTHVKSDKN